MKKINSNSINYTDNIYYICRTILIIGLPLTIISGLVLSHLSFHSSAIIPSGTDNLAITISTSCTLGSVVNTPHSKEVYNGNYETNIGKTTIKTLCNDGNGYSIYANGYSNNEEGNNKLINSAYPQYSIDTGLATSGLTSAWAMKLNNIPDDPSPTPPTIESDYNNVYGIVPSYWAKVASRSSGTTDMDEGSSFTTTYAIYTTSNQHAGTYNGQVKYVLTHPSTQPYVYYMQEVDKWKNTIALEESVQAIDMRDGKKYWVTKLKDGNIWMTQNLDLDLDPAKSLTSNDTDLTDHSLTGAYLDNYNYDANTGIITWIPTRKTINFTGNNNVTVSGWSDNNTTPYSASKTDDPETGHMSLGNYYNWTAAIASNNSSSLTQNTLSDISNNPKNSICPKGWRLPTISNDSASNIGSTNEFARLNLLYNSGLTSSGIALMTNPLYFRKGGDPVLETLHNYNSIGFYRSSTINGNSTYILSFGDSLAKTADSDEYSRKAGFSIRCIAK